MYRIHLCCTLILTLLIGCGAQTLDELRTVVAVATNSAAATSTAASAAPATITPTVFATRTSLLVLRTPSAPATKPPALATRAATPTFTRSAGQTRTPVPTAGLSQSELKYRLFERFAPIFYCDPDYFPVASAEREMLRAEEEFPKIRENLEEYEVILRHNNLTEADTALSQVRLLVYREHKKLNAIELVPAAANFHFELRTGTAPRSEQRIEGLITPSGAITISQQEPSRGGCPICLAANTLIDTPNGQVPVQALRKGMIVWTADANGARRAAVIVQTAQQPVPAGWQLLRIVLDDERELYASPAHPTADGRKLRDLARGNVLDGARVALIESVVYQELATFDILPSGETGAYWADGILVGSTLARSVRNER